MIASASLSILIIKSALNNPATTSEGRAHARKQLLKVCSLCAAFRQRRSSVDNFMLAFVVPLFCPLFSEHRLLTLSYPMPPIPSTERTHQGCILLDQHRYSYPSSAGPESQTQALNVKLSTARPLLPAIFFDVTIDTLNACPFHPPNAWTCCDFTLHAPWRSDTILLASHDQSLDEALVAK